MYSIVCHNYYGTFEAINGFYKTLYGIGFCFMQCQTREKLFISKDRMCRCTIKQTDIFIFLENKSSLSTPSPI